MSAPNREQFVQKVLEVAKEKFTATQIVRADQPFSLKVNGQIASLEDLYRTAALQPEQTTGFIEQWLVEMVRASEGAPDHKASFEELADRIMPMVVREIDGEQVKKELVTQPFINGLCVAYVVDSERSHWYISHAAFDKWNVSVEDLHEKALANLVNRSDAIAAHAAQGPDGDVNLILFQTMDGFDAARILLPSLHEKLREHLGSPFVAGVPNRDILLCFRDDEENVTKLREQIQNDFRQMPHPISDRLLIVTPDGVAPLL